MWQLWAATHGVVAGILAGMSQTGDIDERLRALGLTMYVGFGDDRHTAERSIARARRRTRYSTPTNHPPRSKSAAPCTPSTTQSPITSNPLDSRPQHNYVTTSRLPATKSNYSGFRGFARNRWPLRGRSSRGPVEPTVAG